MKKKLPAILWGLFVFINAAAQKFSEVSNACGLTYIYPGNDNQEVGSGVIVLDVNNDGWDDFFQAGGVFPSKLWLNKKGKFKDVTAAYRLDFLHSYYVQGGASADFNNDGFTDIFICNLGNGMRNGDHQAPVLLMNVEGRYFVPVFDSTFNLPGNYTSSTWGDYNRDGFTDLYVTDYLSRMNNTLDSLGTVLGYDPLCNENKFYINQRGKGFAEKAAAMALNDKGCGLAAAFTDFDNDNDADLILLNDFGEWNHLGNRFFRNEFPENRFSEISGTINFYREIYGMGIGPGDYDNDGDLDYYVTNIGRNFLFKNEKGQFADVAQLLHTDNTFVKDTLRGAAWSGIFLDMDNDGDLDLYVTKGNLRTLTPKTVVSDPNKVFLNNGNGTFTDVSETSGADDILSHRGAAFLDYDHDGDLDLLSSVIKMHWSEFGGRDQKLKLFRNDNNNNNHWIGFKLTGNGKTNTDCIGCSVSLLSDTLLQLREVDGGSGHGSQSSKILYFGLGKSNRPAAVKIKWNGGTVTLTKKLKANRVYHIKENGRIKRLY